jgi:hypothetical protein
MGLVSEPRLTPRAAAPRPPRAKRSRSGVEISRGLLAALVGTLLVCLAGLSFLVGRELGRRQAPPGPPPVSAVPTLAGPTPSFASPPPEPPPPEPTVDPWQGVWIEPESGHNGEPSSAEREAVARYFGELEALESQTAELEDPKRLAMSLLQQLAGGDASGFERLLDTLRQARERLRVVSVPVPCQEHHRRTLELLDAGLRLVERVQQGVQQGDAGMLMAVTGEAQGLEAGAREVEALAQQIRERHGLPKS